MGKLEADEFVCMGCTRKAGKKVVVTGKNVKIVTMTMHRKKKIKGQRKKVKGKAFTRRVARATCPDCGTKLIKFVKS